MYNIDTMSLHEITHETPLRELRAQMADEPGRRLSQTAGKQVAKAK
jgi:hypothetical protein